MEHPERDIRDRIKRRLEARGWTVIVTHGNMFQSGLPDLYCVHEKYPPKWVEVKLPDMKGSRFTVAQRKVFPQFLRCHVGLYILTSATDLELDKLMGKPNVYAYLMQEYTGVDMIHKKVIK